MCEAVGADVAMYLRHRFRQRIGPHSSALVPAGVAVASPRTLAPWSRSPPTTATTSLSSGASSMSTKSSVIASWRRSACRSGSLEGAVVAVFGLTFKAHTDDLRDSPDWRLCTISPPRVRCTRSRSDDHRSAEAVSAAYVGDSRQFAHRCADPYQGCDRCTGLAVLTEWPQYAELDFQRLADVMAPTSAVVDGRNLLCPIWYEGGPDLRRRGTQLAEFSELDSRASRSSRLPSSPPPLRFGVSPSSWARTPRAGGANHEHWLVEHSGLRGTNELTDCIALLIYDAGPWRVWS